MEVTVDEAVRRGVEMHQAGRLAEAEEVYRRVLEVAPGHVDAMQLLGVALGQKGDAPEGARWVEKAVRARPGVGMYWCNWSNLLLAAGFVEEAVMAGREAVRLGDVGGQGWYNLGSALLMKGEATGAVEALEHALREGAAAATGKLGAALALAGRYEEAELRLREAAQMDVMDAGVRYNLGFMLEGIGRSGEARRWMEAALEIGTRDAKLGSDLLLSMQYWGAEEVGRVMEESQRWAEVHEGPWRGEWQARPAWDGKRRLRVGYVSGDFRDHSVSRFLLPLWRHHDRARVEVIAYSNGAAPDGVTETLKGLADGWRETGGRGDEEVAELIRRDGVDLLVDLSGHTAGNRLGVFARKPAAVQVSWLGYPGTTGLSGMDWFLSDGVAEVEGSEGWHSEGVWRLPRTGWCYEPPVGCPEVAERPRGAGVVFGSFNALAKVTEETMGMWALVLKEMPRARLMLKNAGSSGEVVRENVWHGFERLGIGRERVVLRGWEAEGRSHLAAYGEVDVALDTFPYGGTTTTCEALWMGVPVVTWKGMAHASRVGASLLGQVGLGELVALDGAGFVERAVRIGGDEAWRREWRGKLRGVMAGSSLMDGEGFARDVEEAYFAMVRSKS